MGDNGLLIYILCAVFVAVVSFNVYLNVTHDSKFYQRSEEHIFSCLVLSIATGLFFPLMIPLVACVLLFYKYVIKSIFDKYMFDENGKPMIRK